MKLEMLRVFQVTAERGSLAAAASSLGRTPSAVSMMLLQLEQDVGGALFEAGRKNRLTPLGALVLEESRRANEAFERSTKAIRRYARSTAGSVRIAAVPSATISLLPAIVLQFRHERPEVRLDISDVDSATVRRRIQFDEADIGIVSAKPEDAFDSALIQTAPLGIVCRRGGPLATAAQATSPSWALLAHEPLIVNPLCNLVPNPVVQDHVLRSSLEARNTTALLAFVQAGLGATILPQSAIQDAQGALAFVEPKDPPTLRHLHKIRQTGRRSSPAVEAFWNSLPHLG